MKKIVFLLAALVLAGCGPEPIESGYVIGHSYDNPDHWTTREADYRYSCQYEFAYNYQDGEYNFHNVCKDRVVGHHTEQHYDGPHWYIKVRDDKDRENTQKMEVTEREYNEYQVGMHWPDAR